MILQITTIICGFILPRLILVIYGSEVNGLINSISQFLGIINLLDMGVGAVVQSALYKPLADNDLQTVSKIHSSSSRFFRNIALILTAYVILLVIIYPTLINNDFDFQYTALLIAAMSISNFAEYYFGITNRLLITADQRGYIYYILQIATLISGTAASALLACCGADIQLVKLVYSVIFFIRPLVLSIFVSHNYRIDKKIKYDTEPIPQKWNGMAQHFASFVLSGTDTIVLTFFSTLANISIYTVYNMVIGGVKSLLLSVTNGFQALIGELFAKKEISKLKVFFSYVEWLLHTSTTIVFGCTCMLLVPFVQVYTSGINDADYIQPLFAVLLTVANACHCYRLPYNILILAAGHYKQTQSNYIIAMIINIVISIAAVWTFGLVGVAVGTLAAMIYQTVWMAWYNSKNIIEHPFSCFLKQAAVDILTAVISSAVTFMIPLTSVSYSGWLLQAAEVFLCWFVIAIIVNMIFYKDKMEMIYRKIFSNRRK